MKWRREKGIKIGRKPQISLVSMKYNRPPICMVRSKFINQQTRSNYKFTIEQTIFFTIAMGFFTIP